MEDSYLASTKALDVPYITYPELLKRRASKTPEKAVYVFIDGENRRTVLTFGELYTKSAKFAKNLVHLGVKKNDIVGLSGRNVPEWLIANFGIQLAGGCPLYLTFYRKDGNDIVDLFRSVGNVKLLIFDPGLEEQNCAIVSKILEKISSLGKIDSNSVSTPEHVISFHSCDHLSFNHSMSDFYSDVDAELPRLDPEDLGGIFLSSGSMGIPKAIPHSHNAIVIMAHQYTFGVSTKHNQEDILYNDRKFSWSAGYPLWEIVSGGTRVVATHSFGSSSLAVLADTVSDIIQRENVTCAVLVPPVIDQLLKVDSPIKLKSIVILGVVGCPSVLSCVGKICDELADMYGMTEFGGLATGFYSADDVKNFKEKVLSVRPFPGVELKVTDENGYLVPVRQRGQIQVRSRKRFTGYLNHQSPLIENMLRTGWLNSEDGGFVTEEGSLVVEGRIKGLLQVYGIKIYPFQIENVMKYRNTISNVVVIPVVEKSTQYHVPCAAVIYHQGCNDTTENIQDFVREAFSVSKEDKLLEPLYVPQVVIEFKEFPLTSSGKPDRHAIAEAVRHKLDGTKYDYIH